jgi:hypothetical protein
MEHAHTYRTQRKGTDDAGRERRLEFNPKPKTYF